MRRLSFFTIIVGLALAGCRIQQQDLSQLPEDPLERATLCFGSAYSYRRLGEVARVDAAELERRRSIEDEMRRATDVRSLVGPGGYDEMSRDINRAADAGNWLLALNRCIQAYGIGALEPVPGLPDAPRERLFVCAISSAVKGRGPDSEDDINLFLDPQAFYFVVQLRKQFGPDVLQERPGELASLGQSVPDQGVVDHFVDRCVSEHPAASLDHRTELPRDDYLRARICALAAQYLTMNNPTNRVRRTFMPRVLRMDPPLRAALDRAVPADGRALTALEVEQAMAGMGPSSSIFAACERSYPGGAAAD